MASLEFSRRFCMAHRLLADPHGKCAVPHGHNEIVRARLRPAQGFRFTAENKLADFEAVKRRWHGWIDGAVDHAFQLNAGDPLIKYFQEYEPQHLPRLLIIPGDPTTEALAACFWLKLQAFLKADALRYEVSQIALVETPTNTVVLTRDSFDPAECGMPPAAWPRRPDMAINDL